MRARKRFCGPNEISSTMETIRKLEKIKNVTKNMDVIPQAGNLKNHKACKKAGKSIKE